MNSIGKMVKATAMGASLAICPQVSYAEGFTGEVFLMRSMDDQRAYISTQLVMASSIAARIKPEVSDCMGRIFFDELGMSDGGFDTVMARIGEFPEFHPSSVLVIVIENECGSFN